ncbi:MAG TPA: HD domain-containing phosphohydrolase [Thermoanaerobaculia bacterium]|nr:HD domain-containing phosphohydrolase [Thermoanaerobaculia bacterium]
MSNAAVDAPVVTRDVVLAVDDNEQNLQLLEEYLWDWGYDVVLARDGREAVELYPKHDPAVIVLDVMMPNMDGYEACRLIKSSPAGRTIPILMLTALTGADDKIHALESGADDFLNKPINRDELRTRIRSLIRIRNLRKELDSSENIIMTLTSALESKDSRTVGHVHRVAAYAAHLSSKLGMSPGEREIVVKGAMLHDLGMIGVPDHLLTTLPANDEERGRVADHTRMGASILEPLATFAQFVPIVRWHHERFDGTGYPDGLKGDAIPLEAQIVAIADRFDEIHHGSTLTENETMTRLMDEARGGAFDPELVRFFTTSLDEETPAPATSKHMRPRMQPKTRLLCVHDNAMNRELVTATLSGAHMELLQATNGTEALAILDREAVDVVLLDLLSDGDGMSSLRALRADGRWEFLPVVAMTSHRNNAVRQEAIVAGADDLISYPLNRLELVTRIQSLLRIREYHADLEQTQNVICALALALEAKDRYTRGHSQRVGDLGRKFALHVGLDAGKAERIRVAGLLHDIGKIAVPEKLLNKNGPLTRDEFLRVIDHPVIGEEMVRPLTTLTSVLKLIRHHHERYDGRGYPDGLRGDDIPFEVRLLSIVDAYDALTSHRSYRPAPLTHSAAVETLRQEASAGKWDAALVRQFAEMLGDSAPAWAEFSVPAPVLHLA